jgi:hypothetical protein
MILIAANVRQHATARERNCRRRHGLPVCVRHDTLRSEVSGRKQISSRTGTCREETWLDPAMRSSMLIVMLLVACKSNRTGTNTTTGSGALEGSAARPDPCSPAALNLPTAKPVVVWQPPQGCTARQSEGPRLVKTDADAATSFDCKKTKLGVELAKTSLLVVSRTLSPATVGIDALDDGTTVTFVNRFRNPCPDDPRPMPVPMTKVFLLDDAGDRVFADASCTVETKCP